MRRTLRGDPPPARTLTKGRRARWLLVCGVLSFPLYVAMDVVATLRYEGYSYRSQTISELSAVDAPTRPMWVPLGYVYAILVTAFGVGVWVSAGGRRALRIVGGSLVGSGIVNLLWPFAPMHKREVLAAGGGTRSDTLHLVFAGVTVVLTLFTVAFGAVTSGKRFRLYSVVTMAALAVFGALVSVESPRVGKNRPTPWIGVTERANVYGFMLWHVALASALLRSRARVAHVEGTRGEERR